MRVSIVQDTCTGCGKCPEIAPAVFDLHDDGLAYVTDDGRGIELVDGRPKYQGLLGTVAVAPQLEGDVVAAAEECPTECIDVYVSEAESASS